MQRSGISQENTSCAPTRPASRPNEANEMGGRSQGEAGRRKAWFRSGLLHNVIALYGVQACTYALPLVTFPYLAHVLGPSGWGAVIFAQSIGVVIASVVEYGFDISASRETSRHRHDPDRLSSLVSGVLGAKSLLALACVAGAVFSRRFTLGVAPSQILFWSSTLWGVCQGINMLWFFQGLERMQLASVLEISGKVLATRCAAVEPRRGLCFYRCQTGRIRRLRMSVLRPVLLYRQAGCRTV